jgi:hypothetical protein
LISTIEWSTYALAQESAGFSFISEEVLSFDGLNNAEILLSGDVE